MSLTQTLSVDPITLAFQQEQQVLAQSFTLLIDQGAGQQQLVAWQAQNAPQLLAQQQRAISMGAALASQPLSYITDVSVPDDSSPQVENFIAGQANLYNAFVQIHNQRLTSGSTTPLSSDVAIFQQQNASAIQAQVQQVQAVTAQAAQQPLPIPPPLSFPTGISPQKKAFLILRDQLMREEFQLHNLHLQNFPATQASIEVQWRQQNAARLQQLQQLAQALSNTN